MKQPKDDLIINTGYDYIDEIWEIPKKADTQYLTHGMYRYIGKFPPQIPREIIADYGKPGMTILDPMCGGGTTLIEGTIAGCNVIGLDVNPVSLLVSKVVSTPYDVTKLESLLIEIKNIILANDSNSMFYNPTITKTQKKNLDFGESEKYFSDDVKKDCILILNWIDSIKEKVYQDFFYVAILAILRKISFANVKKINVTIDSSKKVKDVFPTYIKQIENMIIAEKKSYDLLSNGTTILKQSDARKMPLEDSSVDMVIIHPPYLSNTAFSESTQLQLAFMGINHKQIWKNELKARGSYLHETDGLRKYLVGWNSVLKESHRVLKSGGICAIENGDGQIDFVRIPIGVITREFSKDIGFKIEKHILHIINNNTGKTLTHKMKDQHIIILRKE